MSKVFKLLVVLGTRPEAIKLAPLILEMRKVIGKENILICNTGQHRDMVSNVLSEFDLTTDFNLNLMKNNQTPSAFFVSSFPEIEKLVINLQPNAVVVQGDTMSGLAGAMAAKYNRINVIHVEAGLRTNNWLSPFPEEMNRQIIGRLTDLHLAATESSRTNLAKEGISQEKIFITGNTAIDSLYFLESKLKSEDVYNLLKYLQSKLLSEYRINPTTELEEIVFVTLHRRESFGDEIKNAMQAVMDLAKNFPNYAFVFAVHPNPNVRESLNEVVHSNKIVPNNLMICEPLDYFTLVRVLIKSILVITDSGGLQEEAPAFGIPVVVTRNETERTESIKLGLAYLAGTDHTKIVNYSTSILEDSEKRSKMKKARQSPYGDGKASSRASQIIMAFLGTQA